MEPHEIVMRSLRDSGEVDYRMELPAIIARSGLPNAENVKIGNSFYVYYKKKNAVVVEDFIQDTGREAFKNAVKFLWHLQKEGVTHATLGADSPADLQRAEVLQKYFSGTDTTVRVAPTKSPDLQYVYVKIGEDPIRRL